MVVTKPKCLICEKTSRGEFTPLVNGKFIHDDCYEKLLNKCSELEKNIDNNQYAISENDREMKSISGFFRSFFGGTQRESRIAELNKKSRSLETQISKQRKNIQAITLALTNFYDYWPDYPPDWNDRTQMAREESNKACAECGTGGRELHVHHIKPKSNGGNHLPDNLETLCVKCHETHHPWLGKVHAGAIKGNRYRDNLEVVNKALAKGQKIKFSYRNYEGKKTKRTIKPKRFIQPGEPYSDRSGYVKNLCISGHCYLRSADRTFTISKIRDAKIIK